MEYKSEWAPDLIICMEGATSRMLACSITKSLVYQEMFALDRPCAKSVNVVLEN